MKNGNPDWDWKNDYLIYLSVDINEWYDILAYYDPNHFKWACFKEPDLDNKITSIAIYEHDFPGIIKRKLQKEKLLERN